MNVLVTGATGFIGSHLAMAMIERGHTVYGLSQSGCCDRIGTMAGHPRFHLLIADVRSAASMTSVLKPCPIDIVCHMAGRQPEGANLASLFQTNTQGVINLMSALDGKRIQHMVLNSTCAVYGAPRYLPVDEYHPTCPEHGYGASKLAGEWFARQFADHMDIPLTVLRFPGVYGARVRDTLIKYLVRSFLRGDPVDLRTPNAVTDYVAVEDVVWSNLASIESSASAGHIMNIAGGIRFNRRILAETVRVACDSGSLIQCLPDGETAGRDTCYSTERARRVLGFTPTPVPQALRHYVNGVRKGGDDGSAEANHQCATALSA